MLLSDLYDDVRRDARGAPDFVILDALQRAAAEFFHQSGAWRERFDPDTFEIGSFEYTIAAPSGTKIGRIESVKLSTASCPLTPITELEFAAHDETATGTPTLYAVAESTGTLLFWPTPDASATQTYSVTAIIVPTREATQIPDAVGERWREGLVCGAQKRLLATPGRPWTNADAAKYNDQCFWDYVTRAKRESISGQFNRPLRVTPRRFV